MRDILRWMVLGNGLKAVLRALAEVCEEESARSRSASYDRSSGLFFFASGDLKRFAKEVADTPHVEYPIAQTSSK